MRKNIFVIFLFIGIFFLWGATKISAVGPGQEEQKGGAIWHSIAAAHDTFDSNDDVLIYQPGTILNTWWRQLYSCWNTYAIVDYRDKSPVNLSPGDKLKAELHWELIVDGHPENGWYHFVPPSPNWYEVEIVTITLKLAKQDTLNDTCFAECVLPPSSYLDILSPPFNRTWEFLTPPAYPKPFPQRVMDQATTDAAHSNAAPNLHTTYYVHFQGDGWWYIKDVSIDIRLNKCGDPDNPSTTPTMTQWGIFILVALIVASGVFIMLRRRKAVVPA